MDEDVQSWLRYAESDMISAEALHRIGQELNTSSTCSKQWRRA
jgi:hypothetical protein